jgi:hypothetical protein
LAAFRVWRDGPSGDFLKPKATNIIPALDALFMHHVGIKVFQMSGAASAI